MTEHQKAKAWRINRNLTREKLSELTGYSPESIYWFEQGTTPPAKGRRPKKTEPWVWLRYQRCCAGVEAEIAGRPFTWGV